jgi:uncharacterized membrane protein
MRKWTPFAMAFVAVVLSAVAAPLMPDVIPVHWNWKGDVDGWAPKAVALVVSPVLMLALIALFYGLPRLDPMRDNYRKFWPEYELIIGAVVAAMLVMHVALLITAFGLRIDMIKFALVMTGGLFVLLGNIMPRIRRNHTAGFRTRATLGSDQVWNRTHRVGGAIMMVTGLLVALAAFAPTPLGIPLLLLLVLGMAGTIAVYSSRIARQDATYPPRA